VNGADAESDGPGTPSVAAPALAQVPLLNVANALTVARMALVPVFLLALFAGGGRDFVWRLAAAAVFALASITDHVDGNIARRRGLVTDFGKIADPIADKVLTGAALIGLSVLGELPWWVTGVIAAREVGVTLVRFWVIRYEVIAASRAGKAKTLLQVVAIALYVIPFPPAVGPVRWLTMGAAIVLTVLTGLDYGVRAVRLRAMSRRALAGTAEHH
jgi:CDP-diacylglycerol---glycerol-3-phosphate 3-phosphatidyltransferase